METRMNRRREPILKRIAIVAAVALIVGSQMVMGNACGNSGSGSGKTAGAGTGTSTGQTGTSTGTGTGTGGGGTGVSTGKVVFAEMFTFST